MELKSIELAGRNGKRIGTITRKVNDDVITVSIDYETDNYRSERGASITDEPGIYRLAEFLQNELENTGTIRHFDQAGRCLEIQEYYQLLLQITK